ncbi:PspC domain-containing protein [Micromonospora avicenniae]|uniref:PspC domain-containing protein n=1 Tax=Micromonospora avicenniae TaxID=1198245 RepID=UPI00332D4512
MTEEAAQPPRAGAAPPGGATPPPSASTGWTGSTPFDPASAAGPYPPGAQVPGPAAATGAHIGSGPAGYGPGPGQGAPFGGGESTPGFGPGGTGPAFGSTGAGGTGGTPPPPPGGPAGAAGGPPPGAAGFTTRYGLVRPREGRYLAGVCAAIGRATNTDPVLWRVLLAVLGFFGGIGILVYITAWLIIPGEGDTASPIESMLGRGRSSMSPVTVIVLGIVAAVGFGYIVTDAFRAVLLGAAILIGGALLLNREHRRTQPVPAGPPPAAPPGPVPPVSYPAPAPYAAPPAADPTTMPGAPMPGVGPATGPQPFSGGEPASQEVSAPHGGSGPHAQAPAATAASGQPADRTAELPTWPPAEPPAPHWPAPATRGGWQATPTGAGWRPTAAGSSGYPPTAPMSTSGYRPPFAPRGPYATQSPPAPPPKPPKPPKRPKERSALGPVTFSLIFLALGLVAVLDLLDVFDVGASAYFAAALATIGLGLLVGTWFGRARWLIALGLVTASALAVATVAESYDRFRGVDGAVTWAPASYQDLATRYENSFGDAVLDLRSVDFAGRNTEITVSVNFGKGTVVVPPNVDVTAVADVNAGDATVFGQHQPGPAGGAREFTDLGPDGAGGGTLRLFVHINAGSLVVTR